MVVAERTELCSTSRRNIVDRLQVACHAGLLNPRRAQVLVLLERQVVESQVVEGHQNL